MNTAPHILVVDDEPLVSLLIADWLAELGYHVVGPVGRAHEAMQLIEEAPLDGALLDINLGTVTALHWQMRCAQRAFR